MTGDAPLRVLVADDHDLFRAGLVNLLESRQIEVVANVADGSAAVEAYRAHRPDIALLDLSMPIATGLEATRGILAIDPDARVAILTASEAETSLFAAVRAGARGYLLKDTTPERFFEILEQLVAGQPVVTPRLAHLIHTDFAERSMEAPVEEQLTQREREVLDLLASGVTSNRELTEALDVSTNTVKFHLKNIFEKLHLHSRAEAVRYALKNRLDPGDPTA